MKASEIRKLSADEMNAKLLELKDELFKLRFQQAVNQLDNPMRISAVKKYRSYTYCTERYRASRH